MPDDPKKPGRPRRGRQLASRKREIRLTPAEDEQITELCDAKSLTFSELVRRLVKREIRLQKFSEQKS